MSDARDAAPPRSRSRPLLIGCGVVVLLMLICGGVLAYFGGQAFQGLFEQARRDEELASRWHPPAADAEPDVFAPESVAGYSLSSVDDTAAFPALGIEYDGTHAVYDGPDGTIDVAVYPMDAGTVAGVFDEVIRRIDDKSRFASTSHVRTNRSLTFHLAPPDLHGRFWHANGWLIFVRSATVTDLEPFLVAYVEAVSRDEP